MLQVGFNRGQRLIERMERNGIVGPLAGDGHSRREVLRRTEDAGSPTDAEPRGLATGQVAAAIPDDAYARRIFRIRGGPLDGDELVFPGSLAVATTNSESWLAHEPAVSGTLEYVRAEYPQTGREPERIVPPAAQEKHAPRNQPPHFIVEGCETKSGPRSQFVCAGCAARMGVQERRSLLAKWHQVREGATNTEASHA